MTRPVLGFVGAGQLARMAYQAAIGLDVDVRVLAEQVDDAAAAVVHDVTVGDYRDLPSLQRFAAGCDVVTFDHELVDPAHLRALVAAGHALRPSPEAELYAQDKGHQRRRFAALGLPVPPFAAVTSAADVAGFAEAHGWPVVVKAARGGYDGRGVWVVRDPDEIERLSASITGVDLLVESHVPIARELAVLVARRPGGDAVPYPVVETVQRDGICRELLVPAAVPAEIAGAARCLGERVAEAVDAVGILAVELFWTVDAALLVNEVALRPHNSGHWTIEGAATSQFANHVRAVLDWPLGTADLVAPAAATVNVLGADDGRDPRDALPAALAVPGVAVHLYGKAARPGRKLGHVTAVGDDAGEVRERARRAAAILGKELA